MAVEDFDRIWSELELHSRDTTRGGIITLRVLQDSVFDFFLGVQVPENTRMFLIRIRRENVINKLSLPRSKGYEVRQTVLPEDRGYYATIQLILNDRRYQDIFCRLTEDVASSCSCEASEKAMTQALFTRLAMWQQFLDRYGTEGLSPTAQRGLYGELRFLQDYLIPAVGAGQAVSAWIGPKKAQQDFQMASIAIEVKTSIAKQHQNMQIASEQQLDDTGFEALYLYHLSLRELQGGGETLPGIIDRIRDELSEDPAASTSFEDLLIRAGYLDEHRDKYENTGYAERAEHIFHIIEGFPRIIERTLVNGVGDVEYSVSLSACAPFTMDHEDFRVIIKGCKNE
ncbi:PD-(D/E)XK motif protein [Methanocalculus sp.]|uniref:PD-(D/E)XK motif protein n=1 Tax=Methanocalculus sp. TaxID=2004547 RepID=UPI0026188ED4|nr:PD-(D/E)XK motif protein [Methanocalculus sp.]MDG6249407.1 PD-(D/E)XK motif protein [Methanocalculus sp.]